MFSVGDLVLLKGAHRRVPPLYVRSVLLPNVVACDWIDDAGRHREYRAEQLLLVGSSGASSSPPKPR